MPYFERKVLEQIALRVKGHWPSADVAVVPEEYTGTDGLMVRTRLNSAIVFDLVMSPKGWFAIPVQSNGVYISPVSARRPYSIGVKATASPKAIGDKYYQEIVAVFPAFESFGRMEDSLRQAHVWNFVDLVKVAEARVLSILESTGGTLTPRNGDRVEVRYEGSPTLVIFPNHGLWEMGGPAVGGEVTTTGYDVRGGPDILAIIIGLATRAILDDAPALRSALPAVEEAANGLLLTLAASPIPYVAETASELLAGDS